MTEKKKIPWVPLSGRPVWKILKAARTRAMYGPRYVFVYQRFPNPVIYRGGPRIKKLWRRTAVLSKDKYLVVPKIDDLFGRLKAQALKDGRPVHLWDENIVLRPSKQNLLRKAAELYLLQWFPNEMDTPPWYDDPDASDPWESM